MGDAPAIELNQVTVRHGKRTVLDIDDLRLTDERIGLIGANGSGKSTLLRCLNGLVTPSSGQVRVDGLDTAQSIRQVRRKVGFVFQDPEAQIVMPTIAEEMDLGLKAQRLPSSVRRERMADALQRFGLQGREEDSAHLLSGGEKRRLTLASIFAMHPDILVMDEPTIMLDLPGRRQFRRMIDPLPQRVLIATHDLELLEGFQRVLVLDDGRIHADGSPRAAIEAYLDLVDAREAAA
ncbi:ABC transporter ATP-binding protein [Aquisalimonas lutea]|uniref:energy-coupling factor ABC transporter ATP-binding protein n=1 Tax=Aquisalimonas lutea TaxID=1327750 RepID=UPI0025B2EFE4|nr:ABC transporter ATP-binding protein [Aquisalimonas lutea]MDN3518523.1 ABC transporter ATP-binding protein [Aquisalimonas lutea]